MNTIYLMGTKEDVLNDLKKLVPELTEESLPEISGEGFAAHWIGQIMTTPPVIDSNGNITTPGILTDAYHANVWLFNEDLYSITFATELTIIPRNPVNILA